MAQEKKLEITISKTGQVEVRVKCIAGQSCVDETKFLESALGNVIESRELTAEYYQEPVSEVVTTKTGG
jgi:DUF2997 family protein